MVALIGDIGRFRSDRHLSAYLGLVPQQRSSGGKERLGTISRRGDGYLRTLLMHGARAVVRIMTARPAADNWIGRLLQRRPVNVTVAAQANKTATDRLGRAEQDGGLPAPGDRSRVRGRSPGACDLPGRATT